MKKRKKMSVVLLLLMLILIMDPVGVSAEEVSSEESQEEDAAYEYVYQGESFEISCHQSRVEYEDGSTKNVPPHIFRLSEKGESGDVQESIPEGTEDRAAYCCDVKTTIQTDQEYRCVNIEDAGYFDADTAEALRGIVTEGYWHDWDQQDLVDAEQKANEWIVSQGGGTGVSGLTREEAMTATQAAIWHTACDPDSDDEIRQIIPYGNTAGGNKASENTKDNISLFYTYLLNGQAKVSEKILFTDEHFMKGHEVIKDDSGITLYFHLAGDVGEDDELTLTAVLGDGRAQQLMLTGADGITPDEEGRYSIRFDEVSEEDLQSTMALSLSGWQRVNGAYFYQAKPAEGSDARKTSQNLIGRMTGMVKVYAQALLEIASLTEEEPDVDKIPGIDEIPDIGNEPDITDDPDASGNPSDEDDVGTDALPEAETPSSMTEEKPQTEPEKPKTEPEKPVLQEMNAAVRPDAAAGKAEKYEAVTFGDAAGEPISKEPVTPKAVDESSVATGEDTPMMPWPWLAAAVCAVIAAVIATVAVRDRKE